MSSNYSLSVPHTWEAASSAQHADGRYVYPNTRDFFSSTKSNNRLIFGIVTCILVIAALTFTVFSGIKIAAAHPPASLPG